MSDPSTVKSPVSPGDIVAGKYRIERVLGSGGMGVVVSATHVDLDQKVALKFILPQALSGKGNVERFMREARAVVRLKSEHVARVYDVGRHGEDHPFMVLELLEGLDLSKLNKQKGPLPVADAVEYVLQACEALVEAHAAGIVHRDLKPQNLFVTRRLNGTPLVKVLDFGIAKAIGPGAAGQMALTDSAAIIGSPLYMAPEQMRSARTAEVRSDIWALGVILFELLGGQLPFDGETVTEVCIRVVNEQPEKLLALRPALDEALVAIVMRCLEKEPDARWHNVAALASALEPFSRSAKQGGPVRPWRSFEDTQDSKQESPFANVADATGPATLVTIDTLPPIDDELQPSDDERRARLLAGGTKASAGSKRLTSDTPQPLVSTDPTWAASSSGQSDSKRRPHSFSTGVVVALVACAAAAAAAGGLFLGRGSTPSTTAAASAPIAVATSAAPAVVTGTAATAAPAEPHAAPAPVGVTPATSDVTTQLGQPGQPGQPRLASSPSASAALAGRLLSAGKTPRVSVPRPNEPTSSTPPVPASATAHPPEAKPASDPVSPNGAPILH